MATAAPSRGERLRRGAADGAGAGHQRHLPGQRLDHGALQLGLLKAPIFELEQIALGQRLVAADTFGVGHHAHRVLGEIGGDVGVLGAPADAEQAKPRHEHHARGRVELRFDPADLLVLALEIGLIAGAELSHRLFHMPRELVERAWLGRGENQWRVLGADDVVRRHHAALAVIGELGAVHVGEDVGPGAEGHDEARRISALFVGRKCHGAPDDRRDLGDLGKLVGERARLEHDRPPLAQARLGKRHHLDHALVGLARRLAEGEDAVLVQDQALDPLVLLEHFSRGLGKPEARRDVTHDAHAPVIDLAGKRLAVGLIDDREHRRGMGVVDEFVRQEGVQQRLDRRVWRRRIEQVQALHIDHGLVGERVERAKLPQRLELHRGQALRLDIGHVPAGALDRDHLMLNPEIVLGAGLDRGVAAAMQHEQRVAAEEPRGVDAEREILAHALLGIGLDGVERADVIPSALHGSRCSTPRGKTQEQRLGQRDDVAATRATGLTGRSSSQRRSKICETGDHWMPAFAGMTKSLGTVR